MSTAQVTTSVWSCVPAQPHSKSTAGSWLVLQCRAKHVADPTRLCMHRQPTSVVARVHALRPHKCPCLRLLEVVLQPPLPILLLLCYCYIEGLAIDLHAKGSSCWELSGTITAN